MSRSRLRLLTLAALVGAAFLVVALSGSLSADAVRDRIDALGAAGPLLFIPISACLTVALFPGPLLAGASGLLFGTALGTPVSIASATLGATLAFSLSRWWAHDAVQELAGPRLNALRAWVGRRGFSSVLYARIAPGVPYSLVNYAAGLTPILPALVRRRHGDRRRAARLRLHGARRLAGRPALALRRSRPWWSWSGWRSSGSSWRAATCGARRGRRRSSQLPAVRRGANSIIAARGCAAFLPVCGS